MIESYNADLEKAEPMLYEIENPWGREMKSEFRICVREFMLTPELGLVGSE